MSHAVLGNPRAWILGEFASPAGLVTATKQLRDHGHTALDTYSPYPVHGASEAMRLPKSKVPLIALCGAIAGGCTAYSFQYWMAAVDYPLNIGGRPAHAFPSFIPITFELSVLFCALAIFFGLLMLMKLPQPYHPVFEIEEFASASSHAFWVSVETETLEKDESKVTQVLRQHGATHVAVWKEPNQ
ncbi:MAG: DUF3341 domain-containing protein [Myxococcaceae bacterium]